MKKLLQTNKNGMKKIAVITLFFLSLYGCAPITKVVLPTTGSPPTIEYSKDIKTNLKRDDCYDKILQGTMTICPKSKIKLDSKSSGILQIVGSAKYPGKVYILFFAFPVEKKFTYVLTVTQADNECKMVINDLCIAHHSLNNFYTPPRAPQGSRHHNKIYNPRFQAINDECNKIISDLSKLVEKQ